VNGLRICGQAGPSQPRFPRLNPPCPSRSSLIIQKSSRIDCIISVRSVRRRFLSFPNPHRLNDAGIGHWTFALYSAWELLRGPSCQLARSWREYTPKLSEGRLYRENEGFTFAACRIPSRFEGVGVFRPSRITTLSRILVNPYFYEYLRTHKSATVDCFYMTTRSSLTIAAWNIRRPPLVATLTGTVYPSSNLRGAKKRLIATVANSKIELTYSQHAIYQNSNRNKNGLFQFDRDFGRAGIHPLQEPTGNSPTSSCADSPAQSPPCGVDVRTCLSGLLVTHHCTLDTAFPWPPAVWRLIYGTGIRNPAKRLKT
jgi:hypothetical protein